MQEHHTRRDVRPKDAARGPFPTARPGELPASKWPVADVQVTWHYYLGLLAFQNGEDKRVPQLSPLVFPRS